ncbi:hypothetical protein TNCV_2678611 [Trichonephila clavipes]|nr:hypothetical protein TNCV_2678611 [Trichonephila clavipes]
MENIRGPLQRFLDPGRILQRTAKSQDNINFGPSRILPPAMRGCTLRHCDEAHFWLNGYVNKQNCRIRSEANPQVYVETPLHPEKLTVWCALWAGGILLQKR